MNKKYFKNLYSAMKNTLNHTGAKPENKVCPKCGGELLEMPFRERYGPYEFHCVNCRHIEHVTLTREDIEIREEISKLMVFMRNKYPDIHLGNSNEMIQELPDGRYITLFADESNGYDGEYSSPQVGICLEGKDKTGEPFTIDLVTIDAPNKKLQEYYKSIPNAAVQNTGDIEMRVFSDPGTEDYTEKFIINNDDIDQAINE